MLSLDVARHKSSAAGTCPHGYARQSSNVRLDRLQHRAVTQYERHYSVPYLNSWHHRASKLKAKVKWGSGGHSSQATPLGTSVSQGRSGCIPVPSHCSSQLRAHSAARAFATGSCHHFQSTVLLDASTTYHAHPRLEQTFCSPDCLQRFGSCRCSGSRADQRRSFGCILLA